MIHSLASARAAGLERWFEPALDLLHSLPAAAEPRQRDFFAAERPVWVARAPGRLDVMGGIADYSGALVLQLPLDRSTTVLLQRQDAPRADIAARRDGRWHVFSMDLEPMVTGVLREPGALGDWLTGRDPDRWPAYPLGVLQWCFQRAAPDALRHGVRLMIDSTVPEGKGVSSSAAVEVATMAAASACLGNTPGPEAMATACQWVENHVVGAPCGIMDQMTSVCGREDQLLRLRCQPATVEGHAALPAGFRFFGVDSGLRHAITGADYTTVRCAAFMGYRILAELDALRVAPAGAGRVRIDDPRWRGYLANVDAAEFSARYLGHLPETMSGAEFLDRYGGITDTVTKVRPDRRYPVRAATAHPVLEQARITRFAALLGELRGDPGLASAMGALMEDSHKSYGACGLGSDGTDRLVELVAEAGPAHGLFGAKITGGGSGGTVAILGRADAEPVVRRIAGRYAKDTGRTSEVFGASGPGAAATGVLRLEPGDLA